MKSISIRAEKPYCVLIGQDLLASAGKEIRKHTSASRCVIVTDSNVAPLYAESLSRALLGADFHTVLFVFPAGERSKNGETYLSLLEFLAQKELTRGDLLIALGGGVTGDLAGFAAATYLRGIDYVQIPTSLLAMVDSSVGGKTAIDLAAGKNLAGAFYQPKLVLCDTTLLDTLPDEYFLDGCGEIVKYAVLGDAELFDLLTSHGKAFPREDVIARCVAQKEAFVAEDEFDKGSRQLLNLGHTLGHAIERVSNYSIHHGCAVAAGLCMITRAAMRAEFCPASEGEKILSTIRALGLPIDAPYPLPTILQAARNDKKRKDDRITCVIPRRVGKCELHTLPFDEFERFAEASLL